jgi:uridine kinase
LTCDLDRLTDAIVDKRRLTARKGPILVAISGIDAAGKGTLAALLAARLRARGVRVESIGVDAWLTPLAQLELESAPGEQFYGHAIRFDEVFERVDSLRENPAPEVILLEGIFLLKRELRDLYDLSVWIECGFETAFARALARNQEGLPRESLISDYGRIYFPAQEVHLLRDNPVEFADLIYSSN